MEGTTLLTLTSILPSHFFCPIPERFLGSNGLYNFTTSGYLGRNLLPLVLQENTLGRQNRILPFSSSLITV